MKLTVFNSETFPKGQFGGRSENPRITFGKSGAITFNYWANEKLGVKEGDLISFAQDEEYPANWYVFKDQNGYKLRSHSDQKSLAFNHTQISKSIKESLGLSSDKSHSFFLAGQPEVIGKTKYIGLIHVAKH